MPFPTDMPAAVTGGFDTPRYDSPNLSSYSNSHPRRLHHTTEYQFRPDAGSDLDMFSSSMRRRERPIQQGTPCKQALQCLNPN